MLLLKILKRRGVGGAPREVYKMLGMDTGGGEASFKEKSEFEDGVKLEDGVNAEDGVRVNAE